MSSSAITGPILSDVRRSPSGSAAAPSWSFADATGTGVYLASTDVLALSTAGVQRMRIDADGSLSATSDATVAATFTGTNASNTTELLVKSAGGVGINTRARVIAGYNAGGSNYGGYLAFNTTSTQNVNAEAARFLANGDFSIGRTTSGENVSGGSGFSFSAAKVDPFFSIVNANASGANACAYLNRRTTGHLMVFMTNNGSTNTAVGTISHNGSTITFSGNALSDERWKEDIKPINNALEAVLNTKFVSFQYKENKQISAGVVAQQLQQVSGLSKFVIDGAEESDYKAVDYNAIIGYLGKAIQELKAELDEAKAKIAALESKP